MSGSPTPYRTGKAEIGTGFIDKVFAHLEKGQKQKQKLQKAAAKASGGAQGGHVFTAKEYATLLRQSHKQDGERRVQKAAIREAKTQSSVEALNKIKAKSGTNVKANLDRKGNVKASFTAAGPVRKPAAKKPAAKKTTPVTKPAAKAPAKPTVKPTAKTAAKPAATPRKSVAKPTGKK